MKEQDLIDLGFTKEYGDESYYYYVLEFGMGFCLITNCNDKLFNGKWFVEIFEEDNIRFTLKEDLEQLINLLNKNKK